MKSVCTGPDSSSQLSKFLEGYSQGRKKNSAGILGDQSKPTWNCPSVIRNLIESWLISKMLVLVEGSGGCLGVHAAHESGSWTFSPLLAFIEQTGVRSLQPGFPRGSVVKNFLANAGDMGDASSIPGLGRSPREGNGIPLQYSCLEYPMDRGAWWATVHEATKSRTQLRDWTRTHAHKAAPAWLLPSYLRSWITLSTVFFPVHFCNHVIYFNVCLWPIHTNVWQKPSQYCNYSPIKINQYIF